MKAKKNVANRSPREYALRRIDDARRGTYGWKVQLVRNHKAHAKFFADGQHGGNDKARQAALAYRDQFDLEVPRLSRADKADILRANNTSGVPGVYPWQHTDKNGCLHRYWVARWIPEPRHKPKSRKFSVARYGEEDAKARAIQVRQEAMAFQQQQAYVPQVKRKPQAPPSPRVGQERIAAFLGKKQVEWLTALATEHGLSRSELIDRIVESLRTDTDAATVKFRETFLRRLPMLDYAVEWRNAKRSRNKSGIVGVCRVVRRDGSNEYHYWLSQWTDADGKKRRRQFAVHRFGEEQAKALACQAREEAMDEVRAVLLRRQRAPGDVAK